MIHDTKEAPVAKAKNDLDNYIDKAFTLFKTGKISEDDCKQMLKYVPNAKNSDFSNGPQIVTVRDEFDVHPFMRFNRIAENTLKQMEKEFEDVVKAEENLKREFIVEPKDHMLNPVAVLLCNYLLFQEDTEFGHLMAAKLLLTTDTKKVIKMYNWAAIKQMPSNFFYDYGAIIEDMQRPLFPTQIKELQKEEEKLLNELNQVKELHKTLNEDYTKEIYAKYFGDNNNMFLGGGYLPVLDCNGVQTGVTDVTQVEAVLNTMHSKWVQSEKEKEELNKKLNDCLLKMEDLLRAQRRDNNRQNNNGYNNNYNNFHRNRNDRGRSGRGRGRGHYLGSGYAEEHYYQNSYPEFLPYSSQQPQLQHQQQQQQQQQQQPQYKQSHTNNFNNVM